MYVRWWARWLLLARKAVGASCLSRPNYTRVSTSPRYRAFVTPVTKFAHIHFPASEGARERIIRLGEPEELVFRGGCPRIDLVAEVVASDGDRPPGEDLFEHGVGVPLDLDQPFVIVSQHPVTTEYGTGEQQITATLEAVDKVGLPAIVLWPNADAGSDDVARGLRKWRENGRDQAMHFFKNLPVDTYIRLMHRTGCLVGNSSSGIREGAYLGTPVVDVGTRQHRRERGQNVVEVDHDASAIADAMAEQLGHGRYPSDPIYGDGHAGERIAATLYGLEGVKAQKTISY